MRTASPALVTVPVDFEIDWSKSEASSPAPDDERTVETEIDPRITADLADGTGPVSTFEAPIEGDPACLDLIQRERAALAPFLAVDSTGQLFEDGTALADIGHSNLEGYDRAFKALPAPEEARAAYQRTIAEEARIDCSEDLANMRVNHVGRLAMITAIDGFQDGRPIMGLEIGRQAWRQLTEIAHGPNVNAGLASRTKAPRRLRTRDRADNKPGREVFGIVSQDTTKGYTVFDGPQVADLVCKGLRDAGHLSGAKMTIDYDRETTRYDIRAVVQAPVDVAAFRGVGRVHQLFARVTGGDDGNHSITGGLGCLRIRCLNATLVETKGSTWSRRHVGDLSEIQALVAGMVGQFAEAARSVQEVWGQAAAHHYLDKTTGTALSVQEAVTRLVALGHVPTGGLEPDETVQAIMSAWREEESPTSAAGILMAIQRAAHETTWKTRWGQAEAEEAASSLLYQPVWVLDTPEDTAEA